MRPRMAGLPERTTLVRALRCESWVARCRPDLETDVGEDDTDAGVSGPSERSHSPIRTRSRNPTTKSRRSSTGDALTIANAKAKRGEAETAIWHDLLRPIVTSSE